MNYRIATDLGGDTKAFGVVVPDLPGCFSAGDTLEEAMTAAAEAVVAWIEATRDMGGSIPAASSLDAVCADAAFTGWTFAVVSVDPVSTAVQEPATERSAGRA